jgi:hypothetical protein
MKVAKFSCVSLVAGLVIGVTALWAAAAPASGGGSGIFGGWFVWQVGQKFIGCQSYQACYYCRGTTYSSCELGTYPTGENLGCNGGPLITILTEGSWGGTPMASTQNHICSTTPGGSSLCPQLYHADCSF